MRKEQFYDLLGEIDENYVHEAHSHPGKNGYPWLKWCAVAACVVVIAVLAGSTLPAIPDHRETTPEETHFHRQYVYRIDSGDFTTYVGGKVIDEARIGGKLGEVTLTAGWKDGEGEWLSNESLRGEVYLIDGIPEDVAVALKFIDQGEAITTTHYYVIMNPSADLTAVEEYIIFPINPNDPGDE